MAVSRGLGGTVVSLIFFLLVLYRDWFASVLSAAPLTYLGRRCYGLYLIHPIVFFTIEQNLPGVTGWQFAVLGLGSCLLLAEASWRWMEKPILDVDLSAQIRMRWQAPLDPKTPTP
jgi:peptidoglycan/LPS O-acetylase OafA/YrhL